MTKVPPPPTIWHQISVTGEYARDACFLVLWSFAIIWCLWRPVPEFVSMGSVMVFILLTIFWEFMMLISKILDK
jgi:hypothetical protein